MILNIRQNEDIKQIYVYDAMSTENLKYYLAGIFDINLQTHNIYLRKKSIENESRSPYESIIAREDDFIVDRFDSGDEIILDAIKVKNVTRVFAVHENKK